MACGAPVVSTDCLSGPAEILENGKYGSLVPVGDDAALAAAIEEALARPLPPETLRRRAADFSVAKSADAYLRVLAPEVE
jgi:glycosyltransferase involved in cell wall biosynthesis